MNYYQKKFYPQAFGEIVAPEAINHGIYKNYYYKQNKCTVIYLKFA